MTSPLQSDKDRSAKPGDDDDDDDDGKDTFIAEFIAACSTNNDDLSKVRSMLQAWRTSGNPSGPPQQQPMLSFQPALHAAARNGNTQVVSYLLEEGCEVDPRTVVAASSANSIPVFQTLLDHGYDINLCLGHIGDALSLAVGSDKTPLVEWHLLHGADPNLNLRGETHTALELGSIHASIPTLSLLLSHGAEMRNSSALKLAAYYGRTDVVGFLLDHGAQIGDDDRIDDNEREQGSGNALHAAAEQGQMETVRLLLERGADGRTKDSKMRTPGEVALEKGHKELADMLRRD
ncbi:MAG: hypothetical protein M1816_000563 [Peltula sp. TS41687]|nr:MAG: hypothetical protein M1816_000563 [Peltula sp. TS41687]